LFQVKAKANSTSASSKRNQLLKAVVEANPAALDMPIRADRVVQQLTGLSRAGVRGLFDHHCVTVNGTPCAMPQALLQPGDVVQVSHNPHQRYKEVPKAKPDPAFTVLFEDEHLLVVNKAAHVLTVPTNDGEGNTLLHALEKYLGGPRLPGSRRNQKQRIHVVHRLDRGVSGALVFAKSFEMAAKIKDQFAERKPDRRYLCVVMGEMEQPGGTFRSHLATDGTLNRYSTKKQGHGELAITHYEVINRLRGATVLEVKLETGRRNQIRVHLAEAGHPVLGDPRYPREDPNSARHPLWKDRRLALHARSLGLKHPITGELLAFEAPVPACFSMFLKQRRNHGKHRGETEKDEKKSKQKRPGPGTSVPRDR
jgi:23S rRNA pseudouridine1911/1915/1917 synthase